MDDVRKQLLATALFAKCDGPAFDRVVASTSTKKLAVGERVLSEGDPAHELFVLVEGTCGVFYSGEGGLGVLVKIFGSPSVFGEMELLTGLPRMEYVEAFEPSVVLVVDGRAALALWQQQPASTFAMLTDVARRLCVAAYHERALAFHNVDERLAHLLLSFMDAFAKEASDGWVLIRFPLTRPLIAQCLGVTTRSIDRAFKEWQDAGLVQHRRGFLAFRSRDVLVERCGPDRLALFTKLFPG